MLGGQLNHAILLSSYFYVSGSGPQTLWRLKGKSIDVRVKALCYVCSGPTLVGFLLLWYPVVCTVESLFVFNLFLDLSFYLIGDNA